MILTVVGCSGSFPSADSACSSYLLEADGFRLLIDMGNGALGELQRHCGLYDLDAVLLSHLHADHCIDMCAYFVARYYRHEGGPATAIPVYGPAGTERRLNIAYGDVPDEKCMSEVFDFRTLRPGSFRIGPFDDHHRPGHPPGRGVRLPDRVRRAGAGVLRRHRALRPAARPSPRAPTSSCARRPSRYGKEDIPDLHLNGREAGQAASSAGADRLVLTHIPPWTNPSLNLRDAQAAFAGPVELAKAGAVYEI